MKEKFKFWAVTNAAYLLSRLTSGTLRTEVKNEYRLEENEQSGKGVILSVWHGQLWFPTYYWRNRGYVGLASESRDGEYITEVMEKLGWDMVRGSASRGGSRSLIKLIRRLRRGEVVGITPDGPTGPRREVKPGIIYLAQKTDSIIIPIGVAFRKKKMFSSWDRFELPCPLTKAGLVLGNPLEVNEKELTEEKLFDYSNKLEEKTSLAIEEAEELI